MIVGDKPSPQLLNVDKMEDGAIGAYLRDKLSQGSNFIARMMSKLIIPFFCMPIK